MTPPTFVQWGSFMIYNNNKGTLHNFIISAWKLVIYDQSIFVHITAAIPADIFDCVYY